MRKTYFRKNSLGDFHFCDKTGKTKIHSILKFIKYVNHNVHHIRINLEKHFLQNSYNLQNIIAIFQMI